MSPKIHYYPVSGLPKLAWLASAGRNSLDELAVFHGSSVECRETWMVEGVWDGEFQAGDFHKAENVFGSGLRVEGERIYFVTSSALVDHLFYCFYRDRLLVSNSLLVLLGVTGAFLDDQHDYTQESMSVEEGIRQYKKEFRVLHPEIETFYQVFYENMVFEKGEVSFELKNGVHEITSFERYYELMRDVLERVKRNWEAPERKTPVTAFSTISSGYDSTAVSCLGKEMGVKICFSVKKPASAIPWAPRSGFTDDGASAAEALGLDVVYLDSLSLGASENELFFLCTNYGKSDNNTMLNAVALSPMAVYIEHHCSAAVVFTGFYGNVIWDMNLPERLLGDGIAGSADYSLSEIRLKSGFINVAVPYILARNIRSIMAVSRSEQMKPWRLHNSYDRPIPRRIAESAGVPRQAFGVKKKGVATFYYRFPKSQDLRRQFLHHLRNHYNLSPWFIKTYDVLNRIAFFGQKAVLRTLGPKSMKCRSITFWPDLDIGFLMWIWSTRVLSEKMGRALEGHVVNSVGGKRPSSLPTQSAQSLP
jgi:hypothetical protein